MMEAQAYARAYLAGELPDVPVHVVRHASAAKDEPWDGDGAREVVVRREGGRMLDRWRDSVGLGVYSWAPTEDEAAKLARRVSAAMMAMPVKGAHVCSTVEETLRSDPDPEDKSPRWYGSYTAVCDRTAWE